MGILKTALKLVKAAEKIFGKYFPIILSAEAKFQSLNGAEKFAYAKGQFEKTVLKFLIKKYEQLGIKGEEATIKANGELNEYAGDVANVINVIVAFQQKVGALLPHSQPK